MSVSIKTEHEIELMREAGHLLEKVHDGLIPYIKPGVESVNCIQYTTFYSNYDDSAPSHSYALKLKSLEIAFGDGIVLLFTPFTVT